MDVSREAELLDHRASSPESIRVVIVIQRERARLV
jgi:hypothetical protein